MLHRLVGTAAVAGALGLAAVASAGASGALSSVDDTFLTTISHEGIAYDSPRDAIRAAHDVCVALDDGADPVDLGVEIYDNTDLTTDQAALFVVASVDHYCPEFGALFE